MDRADKRVFQSTEHVTVLIGRVYNLLYEATQVTVTK